MDIISSNKEIIILLLAVFIIRQIVTWKDIRFIRYITTPLVTVLILLLAYKAQMLSTESIYIKMIFWGLVASVIADTVLMIKEFDTLPYGLIYFLSAHILYIIAFIQRYEFIYWNFVLGLILLPIISYLYYKMQRNAGKLAPAVLVYMLTITMMVFTAIGAMGINFNNSSICAGVGAILFLCSDIVLGINAFIKPIKQSSVFVWLLYAPGQFFIALSCF